MAVNYLRFTSLFDGGGGTVPKTLSHRGEVIPKP